MQPSSSRGPVRALVARLRQALAFRTLRFRDRSAIFAHIYRTNGWGTHESVSGLGSTLERTVVIRRELPALLAAVGATSLLDASCGDFNWLQHVALDGIDYIGADIVPALIERNRRLYARPGRQFIVRDIAADPLPRADVILCRDCLIHLSFADIERALANFRRSGARYLLATTHTTVLRNTDIPTGAWRSVNLQRPPFDFPPPTQLLIESAERGKGLGLWRMETLPE